MWHSGIVRPSVVEVDTSGHSGDNIPLFLLFMLSWLQLHIYHPDRDDMDLPLGLGLIFIMTEIIHR